MVFLPKRIARKLGYASSLLLVVVFLVITADRKEYINLKSYIPIDLLPSFFQPESDSFVIDISVENCFNLRAKSIACGIPGASSGQQGNLFRSGEWVKINKDLSLGSSWIKRQYVSYKTLKKSAIRKGRISNVESTAEEEVQSIMEEKTVEDTVVVDIAISNPELDSKIPGNAKTNIPIRVLKSLHSGSQFTDDEYQDLIDTKASTDGKTDALTVDKTKIASNQAIADKPATGESGNKKEGDKYVDDKPNAKNDEGKKAKQKKPSDDTSALDEYNISKEGAKKAGDAKEKEKNKAKAKENGDKKVKEKTKGKGEGKDKEKGDKKDAEKKKEKSDKKDAEKKQEKGDKKENTKRSVADTRKELQVEYHIPDKKELESLGWKYKSHGVWLKYGPSSNSAITGIDVLFGPDCVDPRPNWELIKNRPLRGVSTQDGREAYLTIRRGPKIDYKQPKYQPTLKMNEKGKFKILQVADLHFSTGVGKCRDPVPQESAKNCQADPRTLVFLEKVLSSERPDFVVLTGDQIFGDESPDSETAIFKALNPFIERGIPYAVTMGNHDDEGSLDRKEAMGISAKLPYCLAASGLDEVDGEGNYVVTVQGASTKLPAISMYFLDTHKYSQNPKITPGYDWIKASQLRWLEQRYASLKKSIDAYSHTAHHISLAFFHIPLPEYRNLDQQKVGMNKEGSTAPRYNSGARHLLGNIGVKVVGVGHDHCNDYCLTDITQDGLYQENKIQLCYGGGSGEGGYGGYGGYIRRMRVYEIDTEDGSVRTWKRAENDPNVIFDQQKLVDKGNVI